MVMVAVDGEEGFTETGLGVVLHVIVVVAGETLQGWMATLPELLFAAPVSVSVTAAEEPAAIDFGLGVDKLSEKTSETPCTVSGTVALPPTASGNVGIVTV